MDIIVGLIFWKAVEDMLEFEEYKVKLNNMKPTLDGLGSALKLDDARSEIAELEAESAKEGFWNDLDRSQKVQKRMKQLQQKCEKYEKLQSTWEDLMTICEMALEENDDSMLGELETDYAKLESELEAMRLSTLLSGEYDANNAILSIHPGAGGTEAQDWAQMLYRMYTRWAERHGYTYTLHGLAGRRGGGHQVRHHQDRGRERLRLPQERARRAPPGAHLPLRRLGPAPDQLRRRRGHARDNRHGRDRAARRGHQDGRVPLLRRGRAEGQQDLLRRPSHAHPHRHRRLQPGRAQPLPEPRELPARCSAPSWRR